MQAPWKGEEEKTVCSWKEGGQEGGFRKRSRREGLKKTVEKERKGAFSLPRKDHGEREPDEKGTMKQMEEGRKRVSSVKKGGKQFRAPRKERGARKRKENTFNPGTTGKRGEGLSYRS